MDLRGVEDLRADIVDFLEHEGKRILFERHKKDKSAYATKIICAALGAVAVEAFIPGSAAYITATQVVAITSLHYLYTGGVLSKSSALALLPTFAGQSLGTTAFLWAKSLLPPTGIVDAAAAAVAVMITFAMLCAVKWVLENNYSLDQKEILKEAFNSFRKSGAGIKNLSLAELKDPGKLFDMVSNLMKR